MNLIDLVIPNEKAIDRIADEIVSSGLTGFIPNDTHPAWLKTGELPNSISRIVCLRLAENRAIL